MKRQHLTTQFSEAQNASQPSGLGEGKRPLIRPQVVSAAILAGLGSMALMVLFFGAVVFQLRPPSQGAMGGGVTNWAGLPRSRSGAWYLLSGSLRADSRTAMAVIRYVFSPIPADPSHPTMIAGVIRAPLVVAVTNCSTNLPSV